MTKYLMFGVEGDAVEKFYGISSNNLVVEEACKPTKIALPKNMLGGLSFDGFRGDLRKDRNSYTAYVPMGKVPKYAIFGVAKKKVVAFYGLTNDIEGTEHTQTLPLTLLQGRTASGKLGKKGRYNPISKKYDAQPFYVEIDSRVAV